MEKKTVLIKLPKELYERLKQKAQEKTLGIGPFLRLLIVDYLKKEEKK